MERATCQSHSLWHMPVPLSLSEAGTLTPWHSDTLTPWHTGTLTPWHTGTLAHWHPGTLGWRSPQPQGTVKAWPSSGAGPTWSTRWISWTGPSWAAAGSGSPRRVAGAGAAPAPGNLGHRLTFHAVSRHFEFEHFSTNHCYPTHFYRTPQF